MTCKPFLEARHKLTGKIAVFYNVSIGGSLGVIMRPLKRQLTAEMELKKDTGPAKKVFPRFHDSGPAG